jgi:outer membrane lipoprotein LolB
LTRASAVRPPGATSRRALRAASACVLLAVAAGCATVAPLQAPAAATVDPAFDVAGRISARRGSEAVTANFAWAHSPGDDRFDVSTPLGQVIARLTGDASGVRVERPGESPVAYADWGALTHSVFGVAIPVHGLASWIQGAPSAGTVFAVESDASGRPLVLREQGWEIVYAYADANAAAPARPFRLVMRYPDSEPIEVRIVVDRWSAVAAH